MPSQFVRQHNRPPAAGDLRTRPNPYVDLFAGGTAGGGAAAAAAGKAVFGKAAQQQQPGGGFGTGARRLLCNVASMVAVQLLSRAFNTTPTAIDCGKAAVMYMLRAKTGIRTRLDPWVRAVW
jgi:hypothetical protein